MLLIDTSDQRQLRSTLRELLADRSPSSIVRCIMDTDTGHDESLWRTLADLGLIGLLLPEEFGGVGGDFRDVAVVMEELGRTLACVPYLSTAVLAPTALLASGDRAAMAKHLPELAAGTRTAAFAFAESSSPWNIGDVRLRAVSDDAGWRLTGTKRYVLDGHNSSMLLVVARTDAGLSLFAVDDDAPGLTRTPQPTMDLTRRVADLRLEEVPATLVGTDGAASAVVEQVLRAATGALAAEHIGGAQRVLEMSVDYAKTRVQFGREIGSFQAVKHRCADMLVTVEMAGALAAYAAWCLTQRDDDTELATAMAAAYCSDAYCRVACDNIQVHGGIGFTWEHDAHLYLKRAASMRLFLGAPAHHRKRLAEHLYG